MGTRGFCLVALGLPLLVIAGSASMGQAGEAEQKTQQPPAVEQKAGEAPKESAQAAPAPPAPAAPKPSAETKAPAGLVGTVVAVTPASGTLVVDVPHGKAALRIGADVTNRTRISEGGKKATLADLKAGDRVRITFRRVASGDEALSVAVLKSAKGT
jgi:hypothetical protein